MGPRIQYAKTKDGVSIAFWTMGEGRPFIQMSFIPVSNIQAELEIPEFRTWDENIAKNRMLIRYDCRGAGLSERSVTNLSLEKYVLDLEAVADHLGLDSFDLFAGAGSGPAAIAYTSQHARRIRRLVLWATYGSLTNSLVSRPEINALRTLLDTDWEMFTETIAHVLQGWSEGEPAHRIARMVRESIEPEVVRALWDSTNQWDVTSVLSEITTPTLVLHRRNYKFLEMDSVRKLVTGMPNARLTMLDGSALAFFIQDSDVVLEAIEEFLDEELPDQPEAPAGPIIGTTISRYEITEKIGVGGMGEVYKATDTRLGRPVALKFLPAEFMTNLEAKERFIREARAAALLDHPNICTIHEIDDVDGQTFIAMAYVDGQDLSEKIGSGPVEISEAIEIAIQVAEGLHEAHKKGIIHRDIKSANIMLGESGRVRVMDFGLAKISDKTRLTKTATVMGTVNYMSPEQARGALVDHRTDIWSLGVVLYEMLSGGMPPFDADSDPALLYNIIYEEPEPLATYRKDAPESLLKIIEKMMQKDPAERYQDMTELIDDLRKARSVPTAPAAVASETPAPSIAILPFVNISADPDQEYFCDGLSEELINALTQLKDLRVIARTSAFSFKGQNVDVREIGRRLNVGTVLEGSVRKAANTLRITAQLIDVAGGHHLWSQRYDRELKDVFSIQDEITLTIIEKLRPRLLGEEKSRLATRQTIDIEAYNLYLQGRYFWAKLTEDSFKRAIELYNQVLEKAPRYALAYVGLADCYAVMPFYQKVSPLEIYPHAKAAVSKALEIDDSLAEAHATLGWIKTLQEWDWEGAERECKRALELNPGSWFVHSAYSTYLMFTGRFDEAIAEQKHALELDPLSLYLQVFLAEAYSYAGEDDAAIEILQKTIEMDPHYSGAHLMLGLAYLHTSEYEKAMREFKREREVSRDSNPFPTMAVGLIHALVGERDKAKAILDELIKESMRSYVSPTTVAWLYFALGENDRGFDWLEKAYEDRDPLLTYLKMDRLFTETHSDPRYAALLEKIGLAK